MEKLYGVLVEHFFLVALSSGLTLYSTLDLQCISPLLPLVS